MEKRVKYTNFYVPWLTDAMRLLDELEDNNNMDYEEDSNQFKEKHLLIRPSTLYDACKSNKDYWQLIEDWKINRMTNSEMLEYYGWISKENEISNENYQIASADNKEIEVVFYYFYKGWTEAEIWDLTSVTKQFVKKVISKFRKLIKIRSLANRKFLGKDKKLKPVHHEFIKRNVLNTKSSILTATKVMKLLQDNHPDIGEVSLSTVTRCMKMDWHLSYK